MKPAAPERTCCVCRKKRPQEAFLRVRASSRGVLTLAADALGRSAYFCDSEECRAGLTDKDRLSRALKRRIDDKAGLGLAQEMECRQR